jgi:hypothetical protein
MKDLRTIISEIFGPSAARAAAPDFTTPEGAVRALEAAYIREDLAAAVAAKDFATEARMMLEHLTPDCVTEAAIEEAAEVLELAFRAEMEKEGFPDFLGAACSFLEREDVSPRLVRLTEQCVFVDGETVVRDVYAVKGPRGWRVVNVPS